MLPKPFLERVKLDASILARDYNDMPLDHDAGLSPNGWRNILIHGPPRNSVNRNGLWREIVSRARYRRDRAALKPLYLLALPRGIEPRFQP